MRIVDANDVRLALVEGLGLARNHPPSSDEVLACAVRRIAAMSCPCSRRSIVRAVVGSLEELLPKDTLLDRVDEMLDGLVGHGDLLDLPDDLGGRGRLLHTAPPAFVERDSGSVILLGIAADEIFPLPAGLRKRIVHRGYVRILEADDAGNLPGYLSDFGLLRLKQESWLKAPPKKTPREILDVVDAELDRALQSSGEIPDLQILDWNKPVRFYRGRWSEPKKKSGRFIGRRPQAHGSPLWCYLELEGGRPRRIFDLPREDSQRGCDEAWRIAAAMDAARGSPQLFRRRTDDAGPIIDFFSPIPRWAERRFATVGWSVPPKQCLFSRCIPASELEEELTFIREELWLEETQ